METTLHAALWVAIVLQGTALIALRRRLLEVRHLLQTIDVPQQRRLAAGTRAPAFDTTLRPSGRRVTHHTLLGRLATLLFLSPACGVCAMLIDNLRSAPHDDRLTLLWSGDEDRAPAVGPFDVAVENVNHIAALYGVDAFPTAVVIDANGFVLKYAHPTNYQELAGLLLRETA